MKIQIIDASVALKWFLHEPSGQEAADRVLQELERDPRTFAVPDLFFAEMLHLLGRVFKDMSKVQQAVGALEELGFERVGLGHELLQKAAEFSIKYGISGYDAIYAATAHLLDGEWITFDREAHRKLSRVNLSRIVE